MPVDDAMRDAEQPFFWQWVAVTSVGWFLVHVFPATVLGLGGLLLMAVGQWLLLRRRHVKSAGWWVIATIIGFVVGVAGGGIVGGRLQDSLDGIVDPHFGIRAPFAPGRSIATAMVATIVAGACVGSVLATAQWQVLRRRARHEWCWLLANTASWAGATAVSCFMIGTRTFSPAGAGLIVGIGSGLSLVHCLSAARRKQDRGRRDLPRAA